MKEVTRSRGAGRPPACLSCLASVGILVCMYGVVLMERRRDKDRQEKQ